MAVIKKSLTYPALFVAASDASSRDKSRADYVCDGTNDNVEIQAALDATNTVILSKGTFNIGAAIILDTGNELVGQGKNATTIFLQNTTNTNIFDTNAGSSVYFVRLAHFAIDGNKANQTSNGKGVYGHFAHTWTVEQLHIKNTEGAGVHLLGDASNIALNNRVLFCRIEDTGAQGLWSGDYAPNNHFINNIIGGTDSFYGIELANDEIVVMGNHVHGTASTGIQVTGSNNIIQGNFVESSGGNGFNITANGNRVIGNVSFNNAENGFRVDGGDYNLIQGNKAFDRQGTKTQDYGFEMTSGSTYNTVTDNEFLAANHTTGSINDLSASTTNRIFNNVDYDVHRVYGVNGVNYSPGSDTSVDLATVDVTDAPTFKWNESSDAFEFSKKLILPNGEAIKSSFSGGQLSLQNSDGDGHVVLSSGQDLNSSSGTDKFMVENVTVNGSGTQGYTAHEVNVTETAAGSGTKLLVDLKVGSDSKFSVSNAGAVSADSTITAAGGNLSTGTLTLGTVAGAIDAGGATSVEVPNGAGGTTVDAAGEVCVDTTSATVNFHDGTAERVLNPIQSKTITILNPTSSEDDSIFYTDDAITITKLVFIITGSTSATTTIRHHTDRSNAGNEVVTGGTVANSTTTGNVVTSFNDATVPADSFVWLETTALSGTPASLSVTIFYRQDA